MVGQSIASFNIVQIPRILLGSSAGASDVTSSSENCSSRQSPMSARLLRYARQDRSWASASEKVAALPREQQGFCGSTMTSGLCT